MAKKIVYHHVFPYRIAYTPAAPPRSDGPLGPHPAYLPRDQRSLWSKTPGASPPQGIGSCSTWSCIILCIQNTRNWEKVSSSISQFRSHFTCSTTKKWWWNARAVRGRQLPLVVLPQQHGTNVATMIVVTERHLHAVHRWIANWKPWSIYGWFMMIYRLFACHRWFSLSKIVNKFNNSSCILIWMILNVYVRVQSVYFLPWSCVPNVIKRPTCHGSSSKWPRRYTSTSGGTKSTKRGPA